MTKRNKTCNLEHITIYLSHITHYCFFLSSVPCLLSSVFFFLYQIRFARLVLMKTEIRDTTIFFAFFTIYYSYCKTRIWLFSGRVSFSISNSFDSNLFTLFLLERNTSTGSIDNLIASVL